jgi:hypothetical protein
MLDPVSGAHMAERISERLPEAPSPALQYVSHRPSLEALRRVARALLCRVLRTLKIKGYPLYYPRRLAKRLNRSGPLTPEQARQIHAALAEGLAPA